MCRWHPKLSSIISRLLTKPLKDKDSDIQALLLMGLYQLDYLNTPDHAAISATVEAARELKKAWALKLINGVLRSYQRNRQELNASLANSPSYLSAHPNWLRKFVEKHWGEDAQPVFSANNAHPPLTLRVNTSAVSREDYMAQLQEAGLDACNTPFSPWGITLASPTDVRLLPGFEDGVVSVQDEAAQLAGQLLDLQPNFRVLDACCAPGGKTGHMLEVSETLTTPLSKVVAIDLEERRLERVRQNLDRIEPALQHRVPVSLLCADASDTAAWWDGHPFDRILLDAPCSATGVIRRNPDIKLLRKSTDIAKLAQLQTLLLQRLWPTLKQGGKLVYATCSILPEENRQVICDFLNNHDDAIEVTPNADWGISQAAGRQLLPQTGGHDGFFYACLEKAG